MHAITAPLLLALAAGHVVAQAPDWYQLPITEPHPPGREFHGMAYDEHLQQVVLFGGSVPWTSTYLRDTWIWQSTKWKQAAPSVYPPGLYHPQMAYDSARRKTVLFGGQWTGTGWLPQTWLWDGASQTWSQAAVTTQPSKFLDTAVAFDEINNQTTLITGCYADGQPSSDLWLWNGTSWSQRIPVAQEPWPPARCEPQLAYDRAHGYVILYGGWDGAANWLSDTWVWNGSYWQQKAATTSPVGKFRLAADNTRGTVLALGPVDQPTSLQTWSWSGATWNQISTLHYPPAGGLTAAEMPLGVLVVGGVINGMADTWAYGVPSIIFNKAPIASAGPVQMLPCATPTATAVQLDASGSSDPDNDPLTFSWSGPFGSATGARPIVNLPLGPSLITVTVSDGKASTQATTTVTVTVGVIGFETPLSRLVPDPDPTPMPDSVFNLGRTLPLKLTIACTQPVETGPPLLAAVLRIGDPPPILATGVPSVANPDTSGIFRSNGTGAWIYNFDTSPLLPGMYHLVIRMPDTRAYRAAIALR